MARSDIFKISAFKYERGQNLNF